MPWLPAAGGADSTFKFGISGTSGNFCDDQGLGVVSGVMHG
jgi:hypothetical protein